MEASHEIAVVNNDFQLGNVVQKVDATGDSKMIKSLLLQIKEMQDVMAGQNKALAEAYKDKGVDLGLLESIVKAVGSDVKKAIKAIK